MEERVNYEDDQAMRRRKLILSTAWVFVILNYIYNDIFSLMDSSVLNQFLTGNIDGMIIDQTFLFYGAILMEIPIAMVLLSRVLTFKLNKVLNIIAGLIKTVAVVGSMFVGTGVSMYYLFFGSIEIAGTLFIVWYAWTWKDTSKAK